MDVKLVPLHSRLDLIEPCIKMLVEEWPNGKYERYVGLIVGLYM